MKMPDPDDMRAAADWLRYNEGSPDERDPMLRVAKWLELQADAKYFRDTCRKAGVPVKAALARLTATE